MPPPPNAPSKRTLRVLVTGYGPFRGIIDNPSWLAVAPLHDTVIHTPSDSIHVTAVGPLKVAYKTVLDIVPGLYAKPPRLPRGTGSEDVSTTPPPSEGYDFIFHLGLGRAGALSIEQVGHKSGYQLKDVDGNMAPIISSDAHAMRPPPSAAQQEEAAQLGPQSAIDQGQDKCAQRGFTSKYERFPENMHTEVDAEGLIGHLKAQGETRVRASTDAGYYLCDFITYCGLAESQRALFYPEAGGKSSPRTKSLFMHVPPKDTPHSIEQMTDAVHQVLAWVCTGEKALPR